jgi:hypothetical protein
MQATDKNLLEFIARLAYNIEGLSGELKLYFSQFLTSHFSKTLSRDQIEDVENRKASKRLKLADWERATTIFSTEDKVWCVAALYLLQAQAEKVDDRIVSRKIGQLSRELISAFGIAADGLLIQAEQKRIEEEIHQFRNRIVVKIPTKIWPLALDYTIRFAFLFGFTYWDLNKGYLALNNILFIPFFTIALAFLIGRVHKKANLKLLNSYGGASSYKIEYQVSITQYTWLAFFLGTSIFISYLLPDRLHVLALFGLTFYYFLYLRFFRVGRLGENELVRQLEHKQIDTTTLSVDENDEVIVALETKLNSSTSRLEAYVLESALFGALTFSGFLQIVATDLVSFKDLENFASYIFSTAQAFIHFDWPRFDAGVAGLSDKKSLFCLVSAQSLICSIFFLAVIASRLRFSDIADKVRTALNLAKAYNAKEEVLHDELEISGKTTKRLEALTAKVNEQLYQATLVLEEINPVMQYMQYFRNAGILVFLIILISSSLFITSVLGWTFLLLSVVTYFYFNRARIITQLKSFFLSFRIAFVKRGYWLLAAAFLPQVLGFIIRVFFHVRDTDWLFALSYFLVGLYLFAWLILAAHVDERFGEIETNNNERSRLSRWKFVKNALAVLILIGSIGVVFKQQHFQGANEILILSLGAICYAMYFLGYYLAKIRWVGILCGVILATSIVGVLFKIQHWEGADEMLLIGLSCSLILIPIIIWKRENFHFLLIRFCITGILISVYYSTFFNRLRLPFEIAYEHETSQPGALVEIVNHYDSRVFLEVGQSAIEESILISDGYLIKYNTMFGYTSIYRSMVVNYQNYAREVLHQMIEKTKIDSSHLPLALKAVRQEYKIAKLFNFEPTLDYGLESDILLSMGKKQEAIQALEELEKLIPARYENDKATLKGKLASLKKETP